MPEAMPESGAERVILHFDMDCFYAAVEVRDRPELAGLPVAVGGGSRRGVLTTCSYEARKFGCHSGMPVYEAKRLCPKLVLLPVRFERYREVSAQVRGILHAVTDRVEPLSLDEAYLDATGLGLEGLELARRLKGEIRETTGLTASAGVGPNKLVAKIASDLRKPDGLVRVLTEEVEAFLEPLPVRRIWGVGPIAEKALRIRGVHTIGELRALPLEELLRMFGKFGGELYELARGRDDRPVEPERPRKSLGTEHTFEEPIRDIEDARRELRRLILELRDEFRAKETDREVQSAVVKVKWSDFRQSTAERRCTQPRPADFLELLDTVWARHDRPVRLLGVALRFVDPERTGGDRRVEQLELWD